MLKTFLIGLKDLRITFRDRAALILMLAAPFVLTVGLGLVTGRFSGGNSGLSDIPVVIVNQDGEDLGNALVDLFHSAELADLIEPSESSDPEAARRFIDEDEAAAAIIIPAGFTRSILPQASDFANSDGPALTPVQIEVYTNPSRPTSSGIVTAIVDEFLSRVDEGRISGTTAILQMLSTGRITPAQLEDTNFAVDASSSDDSSAIAIRSENVDDAPEFDILTYIAPGMALMFLMYTVSYGGRSILAEKTQGTLSRLLVSPTSSVQILGGKIFGIFLTGAAQMLILIGATSLFFQVKWGDPLGLVLLVLAAVVGATGWGMLITALARSPAQVGSVGSAIMLIFGILGGSFINIDQLPPTIQSLSRITPNAWAMDGFTSLGLGGTLADLRTPILALLTMGLVLFMVSVFLFGKKNLVQK
jgi:ABC-2 type transport system permease protein